MPLSPEFLPLQAIFTPWVDNYTPACARCARFSEAYLHYVILICKDLEKITAFFMAILWQRKGKANFFALILPFCRA